MRHLESFPDDAVEELFLEVFAFDWHDSKLRETLAGVLQDCGFETERVKAKEHGDAKKRLPKEPFSSEFRGRLGSHLA